MCVIRKSTWTTHKPDARPAALFAAVIFGVIGFAAFRYGKKHALVPPIAIGLALMMYPYFVSQTWLIYAIGCALCGGLYVLRD